MKYGQIRKYDIANGEGIRTSVFVTGCTHHCFNCFNEEYQDADFGTLWTDAETDLVVSYVSDPNVAGLTLLGGEPMENVEGLLPLCDTVKAAVPDKSIWVYSGYTFEQIMACDHKRSLLARCDVLVDGPYVDELRNPSLAFRGSSNQRVLDVKASLAAQAPVIIEKFV